MKDTPITADTYIPDSVYDALVERLVLLVQEPLEHAAGDAQTQVSAALGEIGGVWPEEVLR